jgi:type VI secretion system secreted protein VgrG
MIVFGAGIGGGFQNLGVLRNPKKSMLGGLEAYSIVGSTVNNTGISYCNKNLGCNAAAAAITGLTVGGDLEIGTQKGQAIYIEATTVFYKYFNLPHIATFDGDMGGRTYTPGVYFAGAAITNSTIVTLDAQGDPMAEFVFQIGAAFAPAASSQIIMVNEARSENIYWLCVGAPGIGAAATVCGNIMSVAAVGIGLGALINGRVISCGDAVNLAANTIIS